MMRLVMVLALVPILLAPVRLQDSSPNFMLPSGLSPAPEAYSLPSAEPIGSPAVIPVSPTILPVVEERSVSPSLNLPHQATPTQPPVVIEKVYVPVPIDTDMPLKRAALCQRAMVLVQDLAMLSYGQKEHKGLFNLALAAAASAGLATERTWPDMNSFNRGVTGLPWFYPNSSELKQAISAARSMCGR